MCPSLILVLSLYLFPLLGTPLSGYDLQNACQRHGQKQPMKELYSHNKRLADRAYVGTLGSLVYHQASH